jgi:probable HAF family extracellular repeat protein
MPLRKSVLSLAVLLLATASLALAQGTYTQIDYPGGVSIQTRCWGIDTAGDISGYYRGGSGYVHGFLLSGGIYTTVDYPGALFTQLHGINDVGQVVGSYNGGFVPGGFVFDIPTQTFTAVSDPAHPVTIPLAINDAGTITGYIEQTASGTVGFELVGSTYRVISPPGTSYSAADGITALGEVVGYGKHNNQILNFSFTGGEYRGIAFPTGGNPEVDGVNPAGTALVGAYAPSGNTEGFLYQDRTLQSFPGSTYTSANGINSAGEVVGYFTDANGDDHGFTWTPPADAGKK